MVNHSHPHLAVLDTVNTLDDGESSMYKGRTLLLEAGLRFQKLCCCQTTVVEP